MKPTHFCYVLYLPNEIADFRLSALSQAHFSSLVKPEACVLLPHTKEEFLACLPEATHVICWSFQKDWFRLAPQLRVLATPRAGHEELPTDEEMPSRVVRVNGSFHGQLMSETVLAFMLAHARGLYRAVQAQVQGEVWPRLALSGHCFSLAGTKAVILGYGHIGQILGTKLEALGVRVVGIRRANWAQLEEDAASADWLIVILPNTEQTRHVVNATLLARLPSHAVLINVGRGQAVDEEALAQALRQHQLAAAYLDVVQEEPFSSSSPLAGLSENLVLFPHASAFSPQYLNLFFDELAQKGWLER